DVRADLGQVLAVGIEELGPATVRPPGQGSIRAEASGVRPGPGFRARARVRVSGSGSGSGSGSQ
ncbi:hypothetical protein, partial [Streptomyces sp. NPDC051211]|uniref:hypothetical protein n=1 Tax=Streptomyces sp. NPDC051211 TaxID=3154643 RepID=UPI0034504E8A